ncbi:hypothetical protein [Legionella sp. km772]|uniref:hypothetical protein n=1 Tax=Legionella sp. km772 TaxID=2498111 RepID=UPI00131515D8|nr:hypothetical protein [Legionella sp. km772]
MEQAQEFMQAFNQLVEHAESLNIAIPGLVEAQRELNIARDVINDTDHLFAEMDEKAKVTLIRKKLVSAADKIIDAMNDQLKIQVPNPVENSLWQKFLNFFTTTKEMKIYNKQQELLNKLAQGYDMQHEQKALLKVEFKEDNVKVNGLESDNAKARFLKQLNAGSRVEYAFNKEGSLCKVVSGKSEQLSEEDVTDLKNHLKTIDEAPDSSYRIKQIDETPKESVQIKM